MWFLEVCFHTRMRKEEKKTEQNKSKGKTKDNKSKHQKSIKGNGYPLGTQSVYECRQ